MTADDFDHLYNNKRLYVYFRCRFNVILEEKFSLGHDLNWNRTKVERRQTGQERKNMPVFRH